jgi:Type IV secretory system Conjugative DNA transfer
LAGRPIFTPRFRAVARRPALRGLFSLPLLGYGIKCYLISQDINQLKSRESGYGPDETITSNCHVQTAFPPNRLETAEHLSKLTGQTTIVKEQVTRSGRGLASQVSTTMHEVQRPLLTPDECLRMPGPQKTTVDMSEIKNGDPVATFIIQVAALSWAAAQVPEISVAIQSLLKAGFLSAVQLELLFMIGSLQPVTKAARF